MITDKEALKAIKTIAQYCYSQDSQESCQSCAIRKYCDVREDKEGVPIPWLVNELEEEENENEWD